jgi:hypothetical protein
VEQRIALVQREAPDEAREVAVGCALAAGGELEALEIVTRGPGVT